MPLRFSLPYKGASSVRPDCSWCRSYVLELWVQRACVNTPRLTCPPLSPWNALLITLHVQNQTWTLSLTCDRELSLVFGLSGLVNGRANRPTCRAYHHTFSLLFSLIYRLPYSLIFALLITTSEWFSPHLGQGSLWDKRQFVSQRHTLLYQEKIFYHVPWSNLSEVLLIDLGSKVKK